MHQQIYTCVKVDYLEEMDIIKQTKRQIEQKINETLPALLPNKIIQTSKGLATTTGMKGQLHFGSREKRAAPAKILHMYVWGQSSQDMTARQNTVTPASVLPSGKKQCPVYVTTIQNLCLGLLFLHNLCNVCVYKW